MRVIGGKYGGRHLASFKASHLRPTSDRVKESLFNILGTRVEGSRVLDLFAGTGNLSIEAHSRGASQVVSVEKHPSSIAIIRKNQELLGIKAGIEIVRSDVLKYLKNFEGEPYDLVLVDPPFTEKMAHDVMVALSTSRVGDNRTVVAIESAGRERLDDVYQEWTRIDSRDYGDKILSFFERKARD